MIKDPLESFPGYALRRASAAAMERLGRRFETLGLRPTEASVLLVIGSNPLVKQTEIGKLLGIARANMAPLVSRLEEHGYLERRPVDGRSQGLSLTPSGVRVTAQVRRVIEAHENELTARIPAAHRKTFVAILHSLWKQP